MKREVTIDTVLSEYPDLHDQFLSEARMLYDQLAGEKCKHSTWEYRYRWVGKTRRYYIQCLTCFDNRGAIAKDSLVRIGVDSMSLAEFDETASKRQRDDLLAAYYEQKEPLEQKYKNIAWERHEREVGQQRYDYTVYINSPKWKAIRQLVLERDNHICQGCRKNKATQVHHLTYDHFGDELLWELVSVCRRCHERCHSADRGKD